MKRTLTRAAGRILAANPFDLTDAFTFGGLAMVGYGLSLVCVPAAWIVCGAFLTWIGVRR